MGKQHNSLKSIGKDNVESKEEGRRLLCCNKANVRSSSLGFNSNSPLVSEKMQLDYLANIFVEAFLEQKRNERKQQKESSHLLPGIDERTG